MDGAAGKPTFNDALRGAGSVLGCVLLGLLASRIVRHFHGPTELRLLAFATMVAVALALVWPSRTPRPGASSQGER